MTELSRGVGCCFVGWLGPQARDQLLSHPFSLGNLPLQLANVRMAIGVMGSQVCKLGFKTVQFLIEGWQSDGCPIRTLGRALQSSILVRQTLKVNMLLLCSI